MCKWGRKLWPERNPADTLLLDFQPLQLSENRCLLFRSPSPWYLVMATHTNYYKSILHTAIRIKFKNLKHKDNMAGHITFCFLLLFKWNTNSLLVPTKPCMVNVQLHFESFCPSFYIPVTVALFHLLRCLKIRLPRDLYIHCSLPRIFIPFFTWLPS